MGKKALDAAAGAISLTALDILCEPGLLKGATEEWEERMDGKSYESLLEENMTPPVELNQDIMEKYRQ